MESYGVICMSKYQVYFKPITLRSSADMPLCSIIAFQIASRANLVKLLGRNGTCTCCWRSYALTMYTKVESQEKSLERFWLLGRAWLGQPFGKDSTFVYMDEALNFLSLQEFCIFFSSPRSVCAMADGELTRLLRDGGGQSRRHTINITDGIQTF